jgi:hypothetical protein
VTLNRTKFLAYMRERWIEPDSIMLAIVQNSPVLGLIPKDEAMGGRFMRLPIIHTGAQGRSATYATAKTNAVGSDAVAFEVQYVNNFQIAKLEGDIVDDTKGDANAIAEAIDTEMDATIANMKKDLNMGLFGNVGGARGRIGSIATGIAGANCRIVLLNPYDAKFFERGMLLAASANDGTATGHSLLDSGDTITITGVDAANGYLDFASDVTATITGIGANNYLFAAGDFKLKISGFRGWIPTTDPTSGDSFHGVDRTVQVQRLSGIRTNQSGLPIEDGIVAHTAVMGLYDAKPDIVVFNPVRFGALVRSLGADRANRMTSIKGDDARVSYSSVKVATPHGDVDVVSDSGCHVDESVYLTLKTWKLGSVGKLVHVIDDDELMIRRGTGDDWAIDVKSRANLGCKNPGLNGRASLASL